MNNLLVSRLAPTPSGYLHIGNILNFVLTWVLVQQRQGKLILRIDDNDQLRTQDEYLQDIFDSLQWLGITYHEGPQTQQEFKEKFSQAKLFQECERLIQSSSFYSCQCSRKDYQGSYPGTCRDKNLPHSSGNCKRIKLNSPAEDFIVWRKEQIPSYQLISTLHDTQLGITHIVRGYDLQNSTEMQKSLARILNLEHFIEIKFIHHQLMTNTSGKKLSKSLGSSCIKSKRESGVAVQEIYREIATFLNYSQKVSKIEDFLDLDLEIAIH